MNPLPPLPPCPPCSPRLKCPRLFSNRPIIGLLGGIGAGKSFVARLFGELGCLVLDADQAVAQAYQRPDVLAAIRQWWTDAVFDPAGRPDRPAIARIVFSDPDQRKRLEALLHPIVLATWEAAMAQAAGDPAVLAFIWDAPLLLEARLTDRCDALVFVECPRKVRLARVAQQRGWDSKELIRREKSQMPLDKKRQMSDDTVRNDADADQVRIQVRQVLTRILATTRDAARQAGVVANGL